MKYIVKVFKTDKVFGEFDRYDDALRMWQDYYDTVCSDVVIQEEKYR